MSLLKKDLTKKEKVVKVISLLFFVFCVGAFTFETIEEKRADAEYKKLEQAYDNYEYMIISDLYHIRQSSCYLVTTAFEHNQDCYRESIKLQKSCEELLEKYDKYLTGYDSINELHQDVLEATQLICDGTKLLNGSVVDLLQTGYIETKHIDSQAEALETIAKGSNWIATSIDQIVHKSN